MLLDPRVSKAERPECLHALEAELERAYGVDPAELPHDVVTMNSTVEIRDLKSGETETYTLVYPERADNQRGSDFRSGPYRHRDLGLPSRRWREGPDAFGSQDASGWRRSITSPSEPARIICSRARPGRVSRPGRWRGDGCGMRIVDAPPAMTDERNARISATARGHREPEQERDCMRRKLDRAAADQGGRTHPRSVRPNNNSI